MKLLRNGALAWLLVVVGCGGDPEAGNQASGTSSGDAVLIQIAGGEQLPSADSPSANDGPSLASEELIAYGSEQASRLGLTEIYTGDFPGMTKRRMIRVLVPYSRTFYFVEAGKQQGITYEALKLFEKRVNESLGTGHVKVYVVPIPTSRDRMIPALLEGRGDIVAAAMTITPERRKLVDFGDPFAESVREVVVTGGDEPALRSVDDLAGRSIYVRTSSSYYESLDELNQRFARDNKAPMELHPAEESLEDEDLLEMLNGDLIETVVVDDHKAELWAQVFESIRVHDNVAVREGGSVGWAFRKDSPELARKINAFVKDHKRGTLLGNILIKRYWKDTKWVKGALAEKDRRRFDDKLAIFRRYAGQYDFDYLMMMAQGYQESGLDQSVVSPVGAIGVMQLLPSTAADKSVGIPDISTPENNIHAGIKYMRWILDTYFPDETIDKRNRVLFACASYNAGPNRIRRFRAEAEERGLDPNKWFGNVELIAAEKIGRETVQYVGNIYKYYAAYRLVAEQDQRRDAAREAVS